MPDRPDLPEVTREEDEALERDIQEQGILVPIIRDHPGRILDGVRRDRIAKKLGIHKVPTIVVRASPKEGDDLRLATNVLRRHLTRSQLREHIKWLLRCNPEASDRAIASRVGADHKTVAKIRSTGDSPQSATRVGMDGRRRPAHPAAKPAVFTSTPKGQREAEENLGDIGHRLPGGYHSARRVRREAFDAAREEIEATAGATVPEGFQLIHGDFRDHRRAIRSASAGLVIGDLPWSDKALPAAWAKEVYRVLRTGGFCACYPGEANLMRVGHLLEDSGLDFRWNLVAINGDEEGTINQGCTWGTGAGQTTRGRFFQTHRSILLFQKGSGSDTGPIIRDTIYSGKEKQFFAWQQPLSEAEYLVRHFSVPNDLVIDLTFGSGTSAVAVATVGGGRRFTGCEINEGRVRIAQTRVAEALEQISGSQADRRPPRRHPA